MDTEDNMAVKNGITSQGSVCCPRDLSGSGDELLHLNGALAVDAAARAEELPADETTRHTGSCCLHREAPGSARPLADGQVCKNTGLGCSPGRNSLLSEQADAPVGTDDPASSAAVPEIHTEGIAGVSDDFSDDDLEYFECSDVLTAQEDEIWQKRLRFLLESDDEDDLKLSQDCDGCALLLGEVSGDTAPVETPIGFRGHHSTFPGLGVRTDPSVSSQSPLQADMTLAVGHHRPRGPGPRDAAPVASADERPGGPGETDASGHLAAAGRARHTAPDPAAAGAVPSAGGTGAAGTVTGAGTARVAREEGDRDVPRENPQHTGCAFTETLRRNLFKLFNPLELCRYVSTIGQSLQAAAEGRESTAPSASREGVLIPEETESLEVQAREEDEDEDCQWGGKRTQGLPEQNQMPDENVPLGDQGADLINVSQNCENLGVEPQTEGTLGAWEGGGSSQPSAGMLCADITLPADNADLQTPSLTWGQRESCPQEIINHGSRSEEGMSAFPSGGAGSVPDNQECLCAVLPSAKLCAEPGEGEQSSGFHRGDGSDTDLPCSPSGGADPLPALGSACRGDADVSAVHDKLWKLLHEDDSECHIPFADRGVTSLGMRLTDVQLTEQETCCLPPVLMDVREEQEPLPAPGPECSDHLTEQEPLPAPSPECRDHLTEQEPLPAPGPECRDHLTEQEPLPAPSPECRDHLTEQEPLPAPSPECRDHLTEQEPLPAPSPECRDHLTEQEPLPAPGPECRDHLTEQEPLPAPGPECRDHLTEQEPLPAPSPECRDHLTEQEPLPAPGPECRDHLTEQEPLPAPSPECRDHLTEQEPLPAPGPECRDHLTEQEPLPAPSPECRDHLTEQEPLPAPGPECRDHLTEQEPLPAPSPECRDHLTEQEPLPAPGPECRDHLTEQEPLPAPGPECRDHLTEQEPLPAPGPECRDHLTEQEPLPAPTHLTLPGAAAPTACLARVVGEDGAGNGMEARAVGMDGAGNGMEARAVGADGAGNGMEARAVGADGAGNGMEARAVGEDGAGNGMEAREAGMDGAGNGMEAREAGMDGAGNGMEAREAGMDGAGNGMEARAVGADGDGNGMEARAVGADGAGNGMEAPAVCPSANSTLLRPGLHPGHGMSWVNDSVPGEGCSFRGGLADCPEEKGIFPSDNTCQLTRAGHSSVNTMPGSDELNLQAEGDHSDSNAQNNTNSQSCHLPKINSCQDFQVVPAALKHGSEMQLPALTEPPAAITRKDLPQNAEQLPETAKREGAFTPSSRDLLLSDFCLEVASCEAAKPGGEQSEIHTADGHRAETSPGPGVTQVSEGQSAVSPHYKAEPQGRGDQSDTQQLPGTATLLLLTPASHSEGLLPSSSAVACPGTGIQVKTGSTPAGDEGNRNLSVLEAPCRASQGLLHRAPAETRGEGAWCGNEHGSPRAVGHMIKTKAALISSQAQGQEVNSGTEQSCPDGVPPSEADYSISNKEEEVRAAESGVNCGLVHFPPADSGSKGCLEEQTPCSRTRPFPSTSCDPFAIDAERQRNQEGSRSCQAEPEPPRCKQDAAKAGHSAAGAKKKLPPAALPKKPRLEEKGGGKKSGKGEAGVTRRDDRKSEQRKLGLKKDSKAPRLLKKIQAESVPEGSGNVRLCCQFGDIHGDSTVTWTKDSRVLARLQRSAQDDSPVSLEIAKATPKAQGMYYCCLNNTYGKVTAEFHLTAAVLERLSSSGSYEGVEEIEFMQLLFREDSISDSYFGGHLHGVLATEQLHFGEGMHRRAFRSRVRRGLAPVFAPGHACVLKVHSALSPASGTREELVRRNYNLALQECCVQNAAREYAKLYAAEAETLEGFGEVPEIIPIFLIHRPANTIPYATVEEELVGDFVKYSVRDGKEVNFLRRDSEAGQKCCTFQHWVYERTSGNLLVTDLQGVGMKLTDVGIATLAKGYKGFKGNCSFSFIEQFRALHQCNEYCEMLGLKSLRAAHQKQRKATAPKGKTLPSSAAAKKMMPKKGREHRDFISSEH